MIFDLWQFIATPIKAPAGGILVRMSLRNKSPLFNDKPYTDLDVSGLVQRGMDRDDLLPRAVSFVRSLCYQFPIPINANAALLILGLKAFPRYETWEKLGLEGYTESMYTADARRWMIDKGHTKSYEELFKWLVSSYLDLKGGTVPVQVKFQRARLAEIRFGFEMASMERFYGKIELPEKVKGVLREIARYSANHVVERRPNKKKERA